MSTNGNGHPHTCGDNGGKKQDGSPCGAFVSNGGLCRHHADGAKQTSRPTPAKQAQVQVAQEAYLAALVEKEGMQGQAAMAAGVTRQTPWLWRKQDPDFATREQEAMAEGARRAVERKRDERKELAYLGRSRLKELLSMKLTDERGKPVDQKLAHAILRAAEYVTKNDPDDPFTDKQEVEHKGEISLAEKVRADVAKVLADPVLTRRIEDRFLSDN